MSAAADASPATIRTDWTIDEVTALFGTPLMELVRLAGDVHRAFHDPTEVQVNQLLSIKTGACPEDCAYCSQSVHNATGLKPEPLMAKDDVLRIARRAKANGVTRFCMGAAWRDVKDNAQFDRVLDIVRGVADTGLEVCATLGMLNADQARRLEEAGLYAYNHNLDTSPEYYGEIITTRTFQDRLDTIDAVRQTNLTLCSGGIIGMGETTADRISFLHALATLDRHPDSVPINILSRVEGTPLADQPDVPVFDMVRMVAVARLLMPASMVRISAGRHLMSEADQALCFLAGANSIFSSEHKIMLTTPGNDIRDDLAMLATLGLRPRVIAES